MVKTLIPKFILSPVSEDKCESPSWGALKAAFSASLRLCHVTSIFQHSQESLLIPQPYKLDDSAGIRDLGSESLVSRNSLEQFMQKTSNLGYSIHLIMHSQVFAPVTLSSRVAQGPALVLTYS